MEDRVERVSNLFNDISSWVIFEIILVVVVAWFVVKIAAKVLPVFAEFLPASLRQVTLNTIPILRVLILLVSIIWIIPLVFNISLQNFVYIAGALSVAVGFALKDLSSAVIAGLVALFEKPYRLGDWVQIGEDYGEVVSIGMRAIQIRTANDDVVTIPHDRIWSENISNSNNGADTLMCVAEFFISREQSTRGVADLLKDVARTSAYLNLDQPIVLIAENTPIGITYKLKAYPFEPRDQFVFITDLLERGNAALRDREIKFTSFPIELSKGE